LTGHDRGSLRWPPGALANPPFNDSDWCGERLRDDKRWREV
jgi:hypothetical protein